MVVRTASGGLINSERRKHPPRDLLEAFLHLPVANYVHAAGSVSRWDWRPPPTLLARSTAIVVRSISNFLFGPAESSTAQQHAASQH